MWLRTQKSTHRMLLNTTCLFKKTLGLMVFYTNPNPAPQHPQSAWWCRCDPSGLKPIATTKCKMQWASSWSPAGCKGRRKCFQKQHAMVTTFDLICHLLTIVKTNGNQKLMEKKRAPPLWNPILRRATWNLRSQFCKKPHACFHTGSFEAATKLGKLRCSV